jgi:ABC-2 type transport system permease protein
MKAFDIALKDLVRGFRSAYTLIFMFVVPLLVTGMFYFMFGRIAQQGEFSLPRTKVIVANMDKGGPKFQVSTDAIPGSARANTMGELVVNILKSEDMADLVEISLTPNETTAKTAVDQQQAQVAIVIPADFSQQFADTYGEASIEFYQDPTLTLGPMIVRSIMNQFMDGMSGVKIAVNVALDQEEVVNSAIIGALVQQYLSTSLAQSKDPEEELLDVRPPNEKPVDTAKEEKNMLLSIISPIMGGMMVFYAFYTGASSAETILKEEEEHTLQRLFTTPTAQSTILTGKFLSVFLTVLVQVCVMLVAARLIFGIRWGEVIPIGLMVIGIIVTASSCGIFITSFIKSTRQGGVIFGGVLTITGMLGMVSTFGINSATSQKLANSVALLVPQGWAVRGLLQAMNGLPLQKVLISTLALMIWSVVFFGVGVWRFNRRYL